MTRNIFDVFRVLNQMDTDDPKDEPRLKAFGLADNLLGARLIQKGSVGVLEILVDPATTQALMRQNSGLAGMLFVVQKDMYDKVKNSGEGVDG